VCRKCNSTLIDSSVSRLNLSLLWNLGKLPRLCFDEDYNHVTRDYWKIVEDCTVYPNDEDWGCSTMEVVSPPLRGQDGLAELVRVLTVLSELGCTVNDTCGLHVHHDASDLDAEAVRTLAKTYLKFEGVIDSLLDESRENHRYAQTLKFDTVEGMFARVDEAVTSYDIYRIWWDRYVKLNLESLQVHGTVEFRQHEGSLDVCEIAAWVSLTQSMVQKAADWAEVRLTPNKPTVVGLMLAAGACREVRQHYAHKYRHAA
jgi:hypothetical protein